VALPGDRVGRAATGNLVEPVQVTADYVKLYKRALLEAGMKETTVAQRLGGPRLPHSHLPSSASRLVHRRLATH
jgi:hypothetical protein